jgi:hypothetical protein
MKTHKNLFIKIIAFENLLCAAQLAACGKREQPNVMHFLHRLEENLWRLQVELAKQSYQPGEYSTFQIYEPKPRMISAAPFRDRVVHHALVNVIGPLFEKSFIFDSYANRFGKGTHRAIRRYQHFLKLYRYVLKCDIKKYFPSIDHEILKALIRRRIADAKTLWLIDRIIDRSNPRRLVIFRATGFYDSSPPGFRKCAKLQAAFALVEGIAAGERRAAAGELDGACEASGHASFAASVGIEPRMSATLRQRNPKAQTTNSK